MHTGGTRHLVMMGLALLALLNTACRSERIVYQPSVVGCLRAPMRPTTHVRWVLYLTRDRTATAVAFTDARRARYYSYLAPPPEKMETVACLLQGDNPREHSVSYRFDVVSDDVVSFSGASEPLPYVRGEIAQFIGSDLLDVVPRDEERISFVAGPAAESPGVASMTLKQFATSHLEPHLVVTVRWYEATAETRDSPPSFEPQVFDAN